MAGYIKQTHPFMVPTGTEKNIEEHFGNASLKYEGCSVCKIDVPPYWKEPYQNPEFDEVVIVNKGKVMVSVDKEKVTLLSGESMIIKKGSRVRFSNPFKEAADFWSICLPPFSLATVHREQRT